MSTADPPRSDLAVPAWLDGFAYPFAPHFLDVGPGRIHFVDEGQGHPILMVHGTPEWSFGYRHLIQCLSRSYRTIALDHLGFGLSDKPAGWSYLPRDHSRNLEPLVEHLGLPEFSLIVHDFGGPIGLAVALDHPEKVRSLVVFNSWLWSLKGDPHFDGSRFFAGGIGRFLYENMNFSLRFMLPRAMGKKEKLTPEVYHQYQQVFQSPADRHGTWVFAREVLGSSDWYKSLWQRRDRIAHIPMWIGWGMKDFAFRPAELEKWKTGFPTAEVTTFAETRHFVQEEEGEALCPLFEDFFARSVPKNSL